MLKSQVSVEYIFIIGFVTLLTIPLLIIYYSYSNNSKDLVATSQALQIARKIVDSAESVYYLGSPSQTTLKLNFPDGIVSTNLSNMELVFKIKTSAGVTDIVEVSAVNISGSLPITDGIHIVTVKAEGRYVHITSN